MNNEAILLNLWKHEMLRVIVDRFIIVEDCLWFEKYVGILSAEVLSADLVEHLSEETYFVDFMRYDAGNHLFSW